MRKYAYSLMGIKNNKFKVRPLILYFILTTKSNWGVWPTIYDSMIVNRELVNSG